MLGPFAFYPTLGYNLLRNYLQPMKWCWYNRIDDDVILGALPFKSMIEELKREKVGGVVCCVEEYELNAPNAVKPSDWEKNEIKFHHVPMQDFTGSTTRQNVQKAVKFIEGVAAEGKTCYVHCKAGRTRSATIVTCYLMKKHDYLPNVAIELMKLKRPQVLLHDAHWRTVNEFRRFLDKRRSPSVSSASSV